MMHSYHIILASQSPRRRSLLEGLGLPFSIKVIKNIEERFPSDLAASKVPEYLAEKKAAAYKVDDNDLLITADTLVIIDNHILGKPHNYDEAYQMLKLISGRKHHVVTGVCIKTVSRSSLFSVSTDVTFRELRDNEIDFYINTYKPFDKAGAYGIQEWIGFVGVTSIEGSYYNVMGLPVQRIYQELVNVYDVNFLIKNKQDN